MNWSFEVAPRRVALLAVLSLALAACKGEKGDTGDTGAPGAVGPEGAAGLTGPQGPQGAGGKNAATLNTVEPAGANCATGGVRVDFGLDADGNGVLDPGEVDPLRVSYLCNGPQGAQGNQGSQGLPGAPGADGKNTLSATSVEAPGANCVTGGVKVEHGVDADGNGTLDPGEVTASLTQYVCNGAQGPQGIQGAQGAAGTNGTNGTNGRNSLSATTVESPGANCATGGVKVEYGLDVNGNGVLEIAEVNAALTRYVCNGAQGPQGIQGAQGSQGAQGAQGAAGTAGANGLSSLTATAVESPSANCATGGTRVDYGVDTNGNGVLDAAEVNASLRRYVCNGAQGPQGIAGAQGTAGTLGAYGDGSGGALNITNPTDWNATPPANANLQFTDISVTAGVTFTVPSGTVLRATGNVTISGTINVLPGTTDNGQFRPPPGVALGAATQPTAGLAIPKLTAVHLVRLPIYGGGAGARNATCTGGEGGGSFAIFAKGTVNITASGSIFANGRDSVNPATGAVGVVGCGGGAGGVIVIIGKTSLTMAGAVRANAGNGSSGFDMNFGNFEGGGGGGGGGIIHFLSSAAPAVTGTISATAGTGGTTGQGTGGPGVFAGGGGGACGGNGGAGAVAVGTAGAGAPGFSLTTTSPTPESLLL
ncbi:MAG TPA: collagen-like protein [Myxococcaceae bacterium]|nr:collagen-like protein [Myxococcaceae bacterium]